MCWFFFFFFFNFFELESDDFLNRVLNLKVVAKGNRQSSCKMSAAPWKAEGSMWWLRGGHPGTQLSCPAGLPGSHPRSHHLSPTSRNLSRKPRAWTGLLLVLIMPAPGIMPVLRPGPQNSAEVVSGQPSAAQPQELIILKNSYFILEYSWSTTFC